MRRTLDLSQDGGHFLAGEDRGYMSGVLRPLHLSECWKVLLEHMTVEEDQGIQGDILG
jgi:hypothetical protein